MQSEKGNKEQLILEAAQKRFGMYGIEKTSMREIADDLKLSKASLYYYFPDKESLYRAVIEKEQGEFIERIRERMTAHRFGRPASHGICQRTPVLFSAHC